MIKRIYLQIGNILWQNKIPHNCWGKNFIKMFSINYTAACRKRIDVLTNAVDEFMISFNGIFDRTEAEWRSLWHNDCHRVCHFELDQHVDLACRMDIYRIRKRSVDAAEEPRISNKCKLLICVYQRLCAHRITIIFFF